MAPRVPTPAESGTEQLSPAATGGEAVDYRNNLFAQASRERKPELFLRQATVQRAVQFYAKRPDETVVKSSPHASQYWVFAAEGIAFPSLEYFEENLTSFLSGENRSGGRALLAPLFDLVVEGRPSLWVERPAEVEVKDDVLTVKNPGLVHW